MFSPVNRHVVRLLMKRGVTFDKDDFGMHRFGLQPPPSEEEAIVKLLRCEWRKRKWVAQISNFSTSAVKKESGNNPMHVTSKEILPN